MSQLQNDFFEEDNVIVIKSANFFFHNESLEKLMESLKQAKEPKLVKSRKRRGSETEKTNSDSEAKSKQIKNEDIGKRLVVTKNEFLVLLTDLEAIGKPFDNKYVHVSSNKTSVFLVKRNESN